MRPRKLAVLLIAVILVGGGCNIEKPFLLDPVVTAAPPRVFQPPPSGVLQMAKVGLFILETPENVPDVGFPLTQILYQNFLEKNLFLMLEVIDQTYPTPAEAQFLAKKHGWDYIVMGQVPYFLDSGTAAKTGLQVDLRLIDTKTGRPVCYISDAVGAEPSPMVDMIIYDGRPKPSPSVYALAHVLANRLALVLSGQPVPNGMPQPGEKNNSGFKKLVKPITG